MEPIRRRLTASAKDWGISPRVASGIFWAPLFAAAALVLARLDKRVYRFFLGEDGVVEWAQVACFVIAGVFAIGITVLRHRAGQKLQAGIYAIVAITALVAAGEEIGWGQRILGLETPEEWSRINHQHELTLHNVGDVLDVLNPFMMAIGLIGVLACIFGPRLRLDRYWDRAGHLFVPPFFLASSFLVLFLYKFIRLTIVTKSGFTVTKYGELAELCLAFALTAFVWLNYRRLTVEARSSRGIRDSGPVPVREIAPFGPEAGPDPDGIVHGSEMTPR